MVHKAKIKVTDNNVMAKKRRIPCCSSQISWKTKPVKPVSKKLENMRTFLERKTLRKSLKKSKRTKPKTVHCSRRNRIQVPHRRKKNITLETNINTAYFSDATQMRHVAQQLRNERTKREEREHIGIWERKETRRMYHLGIETESPESWIRGWR